MVRVMKLRRMRWARHVAHMGESRGVYRVLVGKPEGKKSLGRWIFSKWDVGVWTELTWLRIGTGCRHL